MFQMLHISILMEIEFLHDIFSVSCKKKKKKLQSIPVGINLFPRLISALRQRWGVGAIPFHVGAWQEPQACQSGRPGAPPHK